MARNTFAPIRRYVLVGALALIPAFAFAQAPTATEWHRGTALALFGGIAVPNEDARGAAGGSILLEFTPRVAIEAAGLWMGAGRHEDDVFGSVALRYSFAGDRPAIPYLTAGAGLYRATFNMQQATQSMAARTGMPWNNGMPWGTGAGWHTGMPWSGVSPWHDAMSATLPDFYQRRMTLGPNGALNARQTFDDFAMKFGGGAEIFAGRHVSFRPEVQVIVVTARHDTHVVPMFGVHLTYHFESHPITPSRR